MGTVKELPANEGNRIHTVEAMEIGTPERIGPRVSGIERANSASESAPQSGVESSLPDAPASSPSRAPVQECHYDA